MEAQWYTDSIAIIVMDVNPYSVILNPRNKIHNHQPDAVPISEPDLRITKRKRVTSETSCVAFPDMLELNWLVALVIEEKHETRPSAKKEVPREYWRQIG